MDVAVETTRSGQQERLSRLHEGLSTGQSISPEDHASHFGVSLSTVESDLRRAYAALAALKERIDEA